MQCIGAIGEMMSPQYSPAMAMFDGGLGTCCDSQPCCAPSDTCAFSPECQEEHHDCGEHHHDHDHDRDMQACNPQCAEDDPNSEQYLEGCIGQLEAQSSQYLQTGDTDYYNDDQQDIAMDSAQLMAMQQCI